MANIYKKLVGSVYFLKSRAKYSIRYMKLILSERNEMLIGEDGSYIVEE